MEMAAIFASLAAVPIIANTLLIFGRTIVVIIYLFVPVYCPYRDTMEICLGNYVEHLVYSIIGHDSVYPFLFTCASQQ